MDEFSTESRQNQVTEAVPWELPADAHRCGTDKGVRGFDLEDRGG
jgi:hypothetical protein